MRKTIWVCDKCGAEIDGEVALVKIAFSISADEDGEELRTEYGPELCPKCTEELRQYLKTKSTPEPQAKPRRKGPRLELDLGKMAALRNAGWSYDKIADELHVSQGTVINRMPEAIEFINSQEAES